MTSATSGCGGQQPDPGAVADLGHRDHPGVEPVERRAVRVGAGRLERDLPRVDGDPDLALGPLGADDLAAAVEGDRGRPGRGRRARSPSSTVAPVKSATNADAGRALSSAAVPRWTIRPRSTTAISPREQRRLGEVVGDEHGRRGRRRQGRAQLARRRGRGTRVERRERLVEQHHAPGRGRARAPARPAGARRRTARATGRRRAPRRRTGAGAPIARGRRSERGSPVSPKATLRHAFRCGNSAYCWNR